MNEPSCPLCHGRKTRYCDDHPDKPCWLTKEPKFIPYTGPVKDTQPQYEQHDFSPKPDLLIQTSNHLTVEEFENNQRILQSKMSFGGVISTLNEIRFVFPNQPSESLEE